MQILNTNYKIDRNFLVAIGELTLRALTLESFLNRRRTFLSRLNPNIHALLSKISSGMVAKIAHSAALILPLAVGTLLGSDCGVIERNVLADRFVVEPSRLFSKIESKDTGIVFLNSFNDPQMWGEKFFEHAFGSIATGVAAGDFDGDGLPDLFFVAKVGPNRLYRNLGSFRFEDVTEHAGVCGSYQGWGSGAVFADFDNDGRLDLYVTRIGAPNELFINVGGGVFRESAQQAGLALTSGSTSACPIDFDRDGFLDLYVATNRVDHRVRAGEPDHLFRNRRDGTFEDVSEAAGLTGSYQTFIGAWWDFDGDGWMDLHTANDFEGPDQLYHNNRNGTFTDVADSVYPVRPYYAMGADTADVDGDGRIDLFVADMYPRSHSEYLKNFAEHTELVKSQDFRLAPQQRRNVLYLNKGVSVVQEAAQYAGISATGWTWSVLFGDLDNDGFQDLYVTNGIFRDFMNSDVVVKLGSAQDDIVRAWKQRQLAPERHIAYKNDGTGRFNDVSVAWGLDELGIGFGAVLVDLDRDGDLDIVVNNYEAEPSIYRNNSQEGARLLVSLSGIKSNRFGVGARVSAIVGNRTLVRELIPARGIVSGSVPEVQFGLGSTKQIDSLIVEWPSGQCDMLRDVPINLQLRIREGSNPSAERVSKKNQMWTEEEDSVGFPAVCRTRNVSNIELGRQPMLPWRLNGVVGALAWADVNGDARSDCFVGGVAGAPGHLAIASGLPGHFEVCRGPWSDDTEVYDSVVLWDDVDGDGDPDLILLSGGAEFPDGADSYKPRLYLNDGNGMFSKGPEDSFPDFRISQGAGAMFSCNGRKFLFIGGRQSIGAYPNSPQSALLEDRKGKFVDITDSEAPILRSIGMITGAVAFIGAVDGQPRLFVSVEWGAPRIFRCTASGWVDDSRRLLPPNLEGLWQCTTAADFNGDGKPDFVIGNFGLNTRYRASPSQPTILLAGSLSDRNRHDLLDLVYDGTELQPWLGRTELIRGLGSKNVAQRILRTMPTYESYSHAKIEEIFPPDILSKADLLPAFELRSGILLSGENDYTFSELPGDSQFAPVMGVAAGDVDNDGLNDIVISQGFSGPIPMFGRLNGAFGVVLKGDGLGHFRAMEPATSGFVVPGDGRGVALLDVDGDGDLDISVARNNSKPLLFLSRKDRVHH